MVQFMDSVAWAGDGGLQSRVASCATREFLEVRASLVFIALEAIVESTSGSRAVVIFEEIFKADRLTLRRIVFGVVSPDGGARSGHSEVLEASNSILEKDVSFNTTLFANRSHVEILHVDSEVLSG
mgnify:CR=1 FL=1